MRALITSLLFVLSTLTFAIVKTDDITTNTPSKTAIDFKKTIDIQTTNGMYLPNGTTAQRPSPYKDGMLRYNSDLDKVEVYANGAWQSVGGGISDWETGKDYAVGDVVIENERIYQCLISHTSGTFATDLANGDWVEVSATPFDSTGLISGGIISIDVDSTKFDIASYELGFSGETAAVSCPALDAQTVTNIATAGITYILVDNTCAVTQQTTFPTPQEKRTKAFIGRVNHPNRTTIQSTINSPNIIVKTNSQFYDLIDSIGPFNKSGNVISPNGANLSIDRSSGTIFRRGSNYATDPENPHEKTFSAATVANLFRSTQSAIGTTLFTTLDVANYDNAGTVTAIGGVGGRSTNQRVYLLSSGNLAVQYGQVIYTSLNNAVAGIPNEAFTPNQNILSSGVLIGVISCRRDATAANNVAQCVFSKVSRFDSSGVSVGSNSVATLQSAYDNSVTPRITTSTALGSVDVKRGSAADTDDVLRVLDGSGVARFFVKGNGDTTIAGTAYTSDQVVTGDITATQNITGFNLSGTNTGDGEVESQAGYLAATQKIIQTPNNQLTTIDVATKKYKIETGNNNELINLGFESPTVGEGWTISNATSSSSTTRIEGGKSLSLALTGALSLSQSSTINASQKSGVQMVASVFVNSSDVSDLQLCSLKNGAEDKCTVTGGYVQGSGWRQLTVSFLGNSTSNGLKLKSTDTSGTVLVDQAYVGLGSPVVDFTPDMEYTARISSTCVVSGENTDWINGNGTLSSTSNCAVTFISGLVTEAMNCTATSNPLADVGGNTILFVANSATGFTTRVVQDGSAASAKNIVVNCQKKGADYKTSKAYVASSSDFGYTNAGAITITATTTNPTKGAVVTDRVFASKNGQRLKAIYQYEQSTAGSAGSGDYLFTLPSGLQFDTNVIIPYTGSAGPQVAGFGGSIVGYGKVSGDTATSHSAILIAYNSTQFRVLSAYSSTGIAFAASGVWGLNYTRSTFNLNIDAPIQGWTDSGVIVGSFQGYNETPGTSRVETFSVSYGTTNATTACSASPCSYLDQIGNAVTSITRSGAGSYVLTTSKTYSKLKCVVSATIGGALNNVGLAGVSSNPLHCSNCNAIGFSTGSNSAGYTDTVGTLLCQGIPQ